MARHTRKINGERLRYAIGRKGSINAFTDRMIKTGIIDSPRTVYNWINAGAIDERLLGPVCDDLEISTVMLTDPEELTEENAQRLTDLDALGVSSRQLELYAHDAFQSVTRFIEFFISESEYLYNCRLIPRPLTEPEIMEHYHDLEQIIKAVITEVMFSGIPPGGYCK